MQTPSHSGVAIRISQPTGLWGVVLFASTTLGIAALFMPLIYVVALVVGLIIIVLVFWQPAIGAGIYVCLNYSRLMEYVPELQQLRIILLLAILLLCSISLHNLLSGDRWWFGGILRNVLVIGFAALASVPLATWKSNSFNAAAEFIKVIVGVVLLANSIKTERQLLWFLRLLALMFAWLSITVVWNHFTGNIVLEGQGAVVRTRGAGSALADSNDVAAVMLMLAPIVVYAIRYDPSRFAKAIYVISLPTSVAALILGGSRGGFLGFLWLLLVLFVRSRRKLTFAVVSSILLIVAWFCAPPYWRERMLTIRNYQTDESAMGRIYLWHAAQGMVKHNPLTGIGIGNFEDFARDYGARTDQVAHNTFFHIMGEQGLLGLSAYFLYLATIWRASMRWAREGGKNPLCAWMANGIGMGYLVFVMPSYFVALSYYAHTYIPAAVLSAGDRIYRAKDAADEAPKARAR